MAELATTGTLHVQVDLAGLPEQTVALIAAKLSQVPCIVNRRTASAVGRPGRLWRSQKRGESARSDALSQAASGRQHLQARSQSWLFSRTSPAWK